MKEQIMNAAVVLFSKKGFYQTSMDDVAQQAGVAKGTLYYHFKNKSQLFCETTVAGIDFMSGEVQSIINQGMTPRDMADKIIALFVEMCTDYAGIVDIVMNEISNGIDADVLQTLKEAKLRFIGRVAHVLDEGKMAGVLRPCDSQSVSGALVSFVYAYCRLAFEKPNASKSAITRELSSILMRGLLY